MTTKIPAPRKNSTGSTVKTIVPPPARPTPLGPGSTPPRHTPTHAPGGK